LLLDGASSAGSCGSSSSGGGGGQEPHFDGDEHLQRRRVEVEGVVGPVLAVQRRRLLSEPLRRVQHPVDAPRAHLEQPSRCHGRAGLIYIHQAAGDLDEAADRIVCRSDPQLDELFLRILVVQQ